MSKKHKHSRSKFRRTGNVPKVVTDHNRMKIDDESTSSKLFTASITSLNEQYNYIRSELIRIAILGGIFFVVLIILSFILK